jgi:circadian clock protein KaiC
VRIPKLNSADRLRKIPTGIAGFDEITGGGVPAGRPTLVCGSAGCGKSLLATEFLIRGIMQYGEPGVLMTFEECGLAGLQRQRSDRAQEAHH